MIGRIALSSKFPWLQAKAMALSSPITWMQTMTIAPCRVGLTLLGMIEEPVFRQQQFAKAAARARGRPAHVVSDLHQRDSEPAHRRHRRNHRAERALRGKFVWRSDERVTVSSAIFSAISRRKPGGALSPVS